MSEGTENFESLPMARTDITAMPQGQYRVYSDQSNFKTVQAVSAIKALQASGLMQAFKIEREDTTKHTIITPDFSKADGEEVVAVEAEKNEEVSAESSAEEESSAETKTEE